MITKITTASKQLAPIRNCCGVKTISIVFGVLNIVAAIIGIAVGVLAYSYSYPQFSVWLSPWPQIMNIEQINEEMKDNYDSKQMDERLYIIFRQSALMYVLDRVFPWVLIAVMSVLTVFSAILIGGIVKKNSDCVKTFFLYGMITLPIGLIINLSSIAAFVSYGLIEHMDFQILLLVFHATFAIQLAVVHNAYQRIRDEERQYLFYKLDTRSDKY